MAGVEDDAVARGVEDPVDGQGQLDDAEVGAEVAAGAWPGPDHQVADLDGQRRRAGSSERSAQVTWDRDRLEMAHVGESMSWQESTATAGSCEAAHPHPAVVLADAGDHVEAVAVHGPVVVVVDQPVPVSSYACTRTVRFGFGWSRLRDPGDLAAQPERSCLQPLDQRVAWRRDGDPDQPVAPPGDVVGIAGQVARPASRAGRPGRRRSTSGPRCGRRSRPPRRTTRRPRARRRWRTRGRP